MSVTILVLSIIINLIELDKIDIQALIPLLDIFSPSSINEKIKNNREEVKLLATWLIKF